MSRKEGEDGVRWEGGQEKQNYNCLQDLLMGQEIQITSCMLALIKKLYHIVFSFYDFYIFVDFIYSFFCFYFFLIPKIFPTTTMTFRSGMCLLSD